MNKPNPAYFMMSLNWLRTYKTEEEMLGQWGFIEETVVRDKVWKFTFAIAALKGMEVSSKTTCLQSTTTKF
jgi:hypothetical protein